MNEKRNQTGVFKNQTIKALDLSQPVHEIAKRLPNSANDIERNEIERQLRDFVLYGNREFPLNDYRKGLATLLDLKKKEFALLKRDSALADKLLISIEEISPVIAKIEYELKKIKPAPILPGRRPEHFFNGLILGLLRVWHQNTKSPVAVSDELVAWVSFAASTLVKHAPDIQSPEALAKRLQRITSENEYLGKAPEN